MNTIINHSQYNPPRKGHCITLYIVSLIALTFGVVLSIAIPCYLHSTFHANRQYNKIVRRVNKEISDSHINQDLISMMANNLTTFDIYNRHVIRKYAPLYVMSMMSTAYLPFEVQPLFQSTKSLLQAQIAQILIEPQPMTDETTSSDDTKYVRFQPLFDLEIGYQVFCVCKGDGQDSIDLPCNEVEESNGDYDILFEPGHFCDLAKEKDSVFSEKTINMMEDFVKDFVEEYDI